MYPAGRTYLSWCLKCVGWILLLPVSILAGVWLPDQILPTPARADFFIGFLFAINVPGLSSELRRALGGRDIKYPRALSVLNIVVLAVFLLIVLVEAVRGDWRPVALGVFTGMGIAAPVLGLGVLGRAFYQRVVGPPVADVTGRPSQASVS